MADLFRELRQSYRLRILLGYIVIVSLVAAGWAFTLYGPLTNAILDQQESHLQSVAQAGALVLARADVPAAATVRQLVARTDLRVTVVAPDGHVLADSSEDPAKMENHGNRPEIRTALAGRVGHDTRLSRTLGIREMYVAVPASLGGQRAALRVAEPLTRIESLASGARRTGLLLLIATLGVSLLVTGRLAERAAAPVARLANAARSMAAGDLSTPIGDEAGELGVLSSALSDLKRQMRSRVTALETERGELRAILDGLPEAVFLLEDGRVAVANAAASRMFRAPASGWQDCVLAETSLPASLVGTIERLSDAGGIEEVGEPARRRLLVGVTVLPPAEGVPRVLVAVSDVTERARLDAVRRDFVANASHELKTPTAGIKLLAESARTAAEDGDTAQALAFVGQIEGEASRLNRLVQDLLDLSRLENASAEGTTDLRVAIDLAMSAHGAPAARKGIALQTDLEDVSGRDVYAAADPTDVAVLLDNLLDNAIKYTERGSVCVRVTTDSDYARVTVSDTGIGIPAEDLPRVCERFYRVDRARGREGGTGLGLALVKHVVERSGGAVAIQSEPGHGTHVVVRLPLAK